MIFCRYFMTKMIWTLACMKARYVGVDCSRARQFLTVKAQFTTLTMTNIIGSTTQVIGLMERERAMEQQTSRMEVYTEVSLIINVRFIPFYVFHFWSKCPKSKKISCPFCLLFLIKNSHFAWSLLDKVDFFFKTIKMTADWMEWSGHYCLLDISIGPFKVNQKMTFFRHT